MGTKDRRERIKQATRQGILLAARRIARSDGWPALTIRKVADEIEYSPSIVYEYFASKDAILLALLQEGFELLGASMRQAAQAPGDPTGRIHGLARAYWEFAREYPELYQVMHGFAGGAIDPAVRGQAALAACAPVEAALVDWARDAGVALDDPLGAAEIAWSTLHGLVSLTIIDGITPDLDRAQALIERATATLLAGWKA
ncbi:MAG TPA: TetR/AcrR family transcriptional regulator [Herpetosiphonaceae bacterium]|nr:TetR/AcrR family transcriptional regulator [Herpetosiphonaceae bacterium]